MIPTYSAMSPMKCQVKTKSLIKGESTLLKACCATENNTVFPAFVTISGRATKQRKHQGKRRPQDHDTYHYGNTLQELQS